MATSLGDRTRTKILTAEQLGTPSNHVAIAYIDSIIPAPPFTEDLQATCDIGFTTTTPIVSDSLTTTTGDVTATAGNIVATAGSMTAGTTMTAGTDITAGTTMTAGTTVTAGTGMTSTTGDIVAAVGRLSVGTTGNPTSATGNIINYGTGSIIAEQGHVRANTYMLADTGNITATLGNITANVGTMTSQVVKVSNLVDGGTSQGTPQLPPFASTPDMTGKTKGCFWIYGTSPNIQFIVETGITDVCLNASVHLTANQYNTANPRILNSYRIGQVGIAPPDNSKLAISVTFDLTVTSSDPIRICILVLPD